MLQAFAVTGLRHLALAHVCYDAEVIATEEPLVSELDDHLEGYDSDSIRPSGSTQSLGPQKETDTQGWVSVCP